MRGRARMKKRNLAIIYLLILTIGTIASLYIPKQEVAKADTAAIVIPDQAIRLRILANSDKESDQAVKRLIRDEVNKDITGWVAELTSIDEARDVITSHLDEIQATAESVMAKEGLNQPVKVKFGQATFPTKLYGQYLYPAGNYEAVIITLGEGEGANWWCVLFPPLCFLDFSNGTAVSKSPFDEKEGRAKASNQTEVEDEKVENSEVHTKKEAVVNPLGSEVNKNKEIAINLSEVKGKIKEKKQKVEQASTEELDKMNEQTKVNKKTKQIYDGNEEPKIIKKSLFAEMFSSIF